MAYLHARLVVEIGRREARAIRDRNMGWYGVYPTDALRQYAHYRQVLERHQSDRIVNDQTLSCVRCAGDDGGPVYWPCDDVIDVAEALGVAQ